MKRKANIIWSFKSRRGGTGDDSSLVLVGTCCWNLRLDPHLLTFQEKMTHSYTNQPHFGRGEGDSSLVLVGTCCWNLRGDFSLVLVGTCCWNLRSDPHIPTFLEKMTHSYTNQPDFGPNFDQNYPIVIFKRFEQINPFIYQILHKLGVIEIPGGWFCYQCWRHVTIGSSVLSTHPGSRTSFITV